MFIGANVRRAVQEGRADYIPIFLHEIERPVQHRRDAADVALVQCARPTYGYLSLGTSVDFTLTAAHAPGT